MLKLRKLFFAALFALCCGQEAFAAGSTLGNLSAGSAISGTDLFYDVQSVGSGGVKITAANLLTYISTPPFALALGTITSNVKALNITGTWNNSGVTFDAPLFMNVTNTASASGSLLVDLQVGGSSQFTVDAAGNIAPAGFIALPGANLDFQYAGTSYFFINAGQNTRLRNSDGFGWSPTGNASASADAGLFRMGAAGVVGLVRLGSLTSPTMFQVYNTTDTQGGTPTNYERAVVDWTTTANTLRFGTENGGTGSVRNMEFVIGGTNKMDYGVTTAGTWTLQGNVNAPGLASLSAATTAWVCWTTSTGALSEDSASCITSLRRYKNNIALFSEATIELMALKPSTFTWKRPLDRNQQGPQLGFIAEDVEQVDPKLSSYSHDGALHGWQEESMIALLVRGFQEQQAEIEQLKRRAAR